MEENNKITETLLTFSEEEMEKLNRRVENLENEAKCSNVTSVVNTVIRCGTKLAIAWLIFGRGGTAKRNIPFFHIRKED